MSNVAEKLEQAANNFRRGDVRSIEPELPSKAAAMGIPEPPLTREQRAGHAAEATLAKQKWQQKIAAHENYLAEKAKYEKERDEAIWARVQARRSASL